MVLVDVLWVRLGDQQGLKMVTGWIEWSCCRQTMQGNAGKGAELPLSCLELAVHTVSSKHLNRPPQHEMTHGPT
jgi:hypothetical protein